jgi:hypothetical protein
MPDLDPRTQDAIRARTAEGLRKAGSNKALAQALELDPADTSRLRTGNPSKRSVASLAGELVWRLSKHPRTTPMPLISELLILATQGIMSGNSTERLQATMADLEARALDAELDLARMVRNGSDPLTLADARQRVAWLYLDLAAHGRELASREDA